MMKKIAAFLALASIAFQGAFAAFPVPTDIAAIYGPTGWIPTAATYAAGSTPNVLGDGSDAKGGTPPAYATMPADIPTPNRSSWLQTGTWSTPGTPATNAFCLVDVEQSGSPAHSCPEPKFRTHAMFSHVLFDDPIRNFGQPGTSHCHEFFGNRFTNANSTYSSLRTRRSSTAAGGELNATAYWFPCVEVVRSTKTYAVKEDFNIIYYNTITGTARLNDQRIPRGFRYVIGFNMDDPDDSQIKKEIAAANAQPGTAGRYSIPAAGYGHGIVGWQCVDQGSSATSGTFQPYLKTPGGADPYSAAYGATCASGQLLMTLAAPECWDGKNLWSPGGYSHVRYTILDNLAPGDHLICPNGWYKLPQLQLVFAFTQTGTADYTTWFLSSDAGAQSKLNSLPQCNAAYSNAPCHEGATARTLGAAETFHTDWMGGWDDTTMVAWHTNCLGLLGASSAHQCDPSVISATENLFYGPLPDGNTVTTTSHFGTASISNMIPLSSVHHGPMIMHNH